MRLWIDKDERGFTLIELVMVIVIVAVLAAISAQKMTRIVASVDREETVAKMDRLAWAVAGNPSLQENGRRSDFGYVGDVGALPSNLDALITDPGLGTWQGPYIANAFEQVADDFKKDSWQAAYVYSGGVTITSTGSGETIIRRLGESADALLYNRVSGLVLDADGTPPGDSGRDSVAVAITFPDGSGSMTSRSVVPDIGGYFSFDSVPIGNHLLEIIYHPTADTLRQYAGIEPGVTAYQEIRLGSNVWRGIDLNGGLVGYWRLDETSGTTAADLTGNYDGALINMAPASDWISGRVNGALDFDGGNDYVDGGSSFPDLSCLTVTAWVNPATIATDRQIISCGFNGAITEWELKTSSPSGRVSFRHWAPGEVGVQSLQTLTAGSWTHLAGVYENGIWKIYFNGLLDNHNAASGPTFTNRRLYLGAVDINGSPGQYWHGALDDVRVYNRALSPDEIYRLSR